jgi:hypothetical protein
VKSLERIGSLPAEESFGSDANYRVHYDLNFIRVVHEHSVRELFGKYGDILWESGRHKYNVTSFVGEIDEILLSRKLSVFSQETLDSILGTLRERGNSNATIALRPALACGNGIRGAARSRKRQTGPQSECCSRSQIRMSSVLPAK